MFFLHDEDDGTHFPSRSPCMWLWRWVATHSTMNCTARVYRGSWRLAGLHTSRCDESSAMCSPYPTSDDSLVAPHTRARAPT